MDWVPPAPTALWFVDNEAAICSLVRATSSQDDVHKLCQASQALFGVLCGRCWCLSRDGLQEEWTPNQGWDLAEYPCPEALMPDVFSNTFADLVRTAGHFGSGEPDLLSTGFDGG